MKTANNHHKVSTVTNNQQETSKNHPDIIKNCQKLPKIAKKCRKNAKNAKNDQKPQKITNSHRQYPSISFSVNMYNICGVCNGEKC